MKKAAGFGLLIAGAILLYVYTPAWRYLSPEGFLEFKRFVESQGFLAPLVFVGIYVLAAIFWIPSSLLTLFGGAIFGTAWGILWVSAGANLGAHAAFFVARYLLSEAVELRLKARLPRVDTEIRERGFFWVLGLRLFPGMPFIAFNYLCGISPVRWRYYFWGTLLGMIPATVAYVSAGSLLGNAASGITLRDPSIWLRPNFWVPFALIVTSLLFMTRLKKRRS